MPSQGRVEQRNWLTVRRHVGYDRLASKKAHALPGQLYPLLSPQLSFFRMIPWTSKIRCRSESLRRARCCRGSAFRPGSDRTNPSSRGRLDGHCLVRTEGSAFAREDHARPPIAAKSRHPLAMTATGHPYLPVMPRKPMHDTDGPTLLGRPGHRTLGLEGKKAFSFFVIDCITNNVFIVSNCHLWSIRLAEGIGSDEPITATFLKSAQPRNSGCLIPHSRASVLRLWCSGSSEPEPACNQAQHLESYSDRFSRHRSRHLPQPFGRCCGGAVIVRGFRPLYKVG